MSNVLIGIIGVILFIGLALAGALFLGPQFQESTNNSRAAAAVQAVSQVASAANMFEVQEGNEADDAAALLAGNYLKSIPTNPTGATADAPEIVGTLVVMPLEGNGNKICAAVAKQTGGAIEPTAAAAAVGAPTGCYSDGTDSFVFARI